MFDNLFARTTPQPEIVQVEVPVFIPVETTAEVSPEAEPAPPASPARRPAPAANNHPDHTNVQVALLLDISGSMNGLIDQAKTRFTCGF